MPTTQILFFKLNHFSKSFVKIILHNHLFNFEDTFQNSQFIFFLSKKKERAMLQHIFFQLCTCSRMCSLYTFFFSFVHARECAYCTPIFYICHVIQFSFYFMLAKDGVKHKCIYVYIFVPVIVLNTKKNDPSLGLGKNSKVMPQLSCYLSFLLGKGGRSLYLKPYLKKKYSSASSN